MKDLIRAMLYILMFFIIWASLLPADEIEYKIDSLLAPVVQVWYKHHGGSGVIVTVRDEKIGYRNFIMTNWHVIQRAIGENEQKQETRDIITVHTYGYIKRARNVMKCIRQARIVEYSKEFDLALLEILDRSIRLHSIDLLPKEETLELFQEIWHVGFPATSHVIFVEGVINGLNKKSNNTKIGFMPKYITTNGPVWFGNSGGLTAREIDGIFYLAAIPSLMDDGYYKKGAPYINWCISAESIRLFLVLNSLSFVFDEKAKIPKFKIYPRPIWDFNIEIDFYDLWKIKK